MVEISWCLSFLMVVLYIVCGILYKSSGSHVNHVCITHVNHTCAGRTGAFLVAENGAFLKKGCRSEWKMVADGLNLSWKGPVLDLMR